MGRHKGWRENTEFTQMNVDSSVKKSWININNHAKRIYIDNAKGKWYVNFMFNENNTKVGITLEHFKTKEQALKFATKYMRAHPNG